MIIKMQVAPLLLPPPTPDLLNNTQKHTMLDFGFVTILQTMASGNIGVIQAAMMEP